MDKKTLYKRTSNGKIEQWSVWTEGADIVSEYGHVDGKLQTARETAKAKNVGRANATTPEQQAELQAQSDYQMKLTRKGYVDELSKAEAGENSGAGGIRPMLAKKFEDHKDKLKYPCFVQPKLDGIRCIAVVEADGKVTLWSREQKPFLSVPSIAKSIESLGLLPGVVLDGELYNHDLKDDFEKIASCVRKQYAASDEEQALIQYHVYDVARIPVGPPENFGLRDDALLRMLSHGITCVVESTFVDGAQVWKTKNLRKVGSWTVQNETQLVELRTYFQNEGFEGAMARNDAPYEEGKRSVHLQKLKEFLEDDFEIVGVEEGVGKMAGLAVFVCKAANGNEFRCKLEGELEGLRKYIQDESTWKGKKLTVQYFSLTNKSKVPRFPVGKAIRDYE